jgi:hypothetical protein
MAAREGLDDQRTGIKAIDDAWEAKEKREMDEFLAPARQAESALESMISKAIAKAVYEMVAKASRGASVERVTIMPKPIAGREGIMPMVSAAVEEDPHSECARFLSAFASGDEPGMRSVVREIVRAEAAA